ncbi:cysteine hydrolase family protein [Candidatus Bipolaricaulota bacterium]
MRHPRSICLLSLILVLLVASSGGAIAGCSTALLVIDMQNFVFNPLSHWYTATGEELIPAVEQLLVLARAAGLEIIYIRDVSQDPEGKFPESYAIVDELLPQEDDSVFTKLSPSAFLNEELEQHLRENGIRKLLISGLMSTGCVEATLLAGLREGFDILVVKDAHSDGADTMRARQRNNTWRGRGIPVELMADIDWVGFHCGGDT